MANSKLPTDQQAALISISSQGNLLGGIDIWPGTAYKAQKSLFDNSFSNNFSFISTLTNNFGHIWFQFVIKSVLLRREHR